MAEGTDAGLHTPVKLQSPYDREDGDVILRSSDGVSYKAHRVILSIASPVFADMFSLPQPPARHQDAPVPVVDLVENSRTLRALLDACYPIADPDLTDLDVVHRALDAAMKYDMAKPVGIIKRGLQVFVARHPLRVFAIACRLHLEEVAVAAAVQASIVGIFTSGYPYVPELEQVPAVCYRQLLQYCRKRTDWQGLVFCALKPEEPVKEDSVKERSESQVWGSDISNAQSPFDTPACDAEIITSDKIRFLVQKSFISMASPCLAEKFVVAASVVPSVSPEDTAPDQVEALAGERISISIEEGGDVLDVLLRLYHPICTPGPLVQDLGFVGRLMDAARKYKMGDKVSWLVRLHWPQYTSLDPVGAYLLASSYGWTTQAKDAAQFLLGETIEEIEGLYSSRMEVITTQSYHHLLAYHARCSAAINSAGLATAAWLDDEAEKRISESCQNCLYYSHKPAQWVAPAISKAVEILRQRPSPRRLKEAIASAELVTLIQEKKCYHCSPFPSAYVKFCHSVASKVQRLIDNFESL